MKDKLYTTESDSSYGQNSKKIADVIRKDYKGASVVVYTSASSEFKGEVICSDTRGIIVLKSEGGIVYINDKDIVAFH